MIRGEGACLICGKPLVYFENARMLKCAVCGGSFPSYASCEDGHFVCDACHAESGVRAIMEFCAKTDSSDPIAIMQQLMETPFIYMHGPEHHIMVGAALMAAYRNSGGELDLAASLAEMESRGRQYPGGSCGFWGCCGAAVSTGMFISILLGATPLSGKSWRYANEMTSRALAQIAELGGPRCCKRNSFTAAKTAVEFVAERLDVQMSLPERITCNFFSENRECLKKHCPYFPEQDASAAQAQQR